MGRCGRRCGEGFFSCVICSNDFESQSTRTCEGNLRFNNHHSNFNVSVIS